MFRDFPEVVESAEELMWIGGAGMAFGIVMHLLTSRKSKSKNLGEGEDRSADGP
jgi:cellobiose-specific phosphotransferase system component IIC